MSETKTQIKQAVADVIKILNSRNREIILRRFGLKTGKKETLEAIGARYGVTRERIRQIEEASLAQMRESLSGAKAALLEPFVSFAKNILQKSGGVLPEDELFSHFPPAHFAFVLTLSEKFYRSPEDENFLTFWALSKERAESFRLQIAALAADLEKNRQMLEVNRVPRGVLSYLTVSKQIGKNIFGQIGLIKWAEIKPHGVRDKSYLVLKKEGQPKHFRKIAELINSIDFDGRKAHVQTVHNELIKDKRFVLIGRGIYGLAEWGYQPGTVKEVIADLIRKEGPLPKEKIIAHVMKSRLVRPNTVALSIQDKDLFYQNENGHIAIKEA